MPDLTDQRRQEETLRRDAQLLASVKESIVCTDLNGIVTYWNDGAARLYGWTAAEMLGRHFYDRMPTEAMRAHARLRMKTAATHGDFFHEREDFRKDGTRIFVDSHVYALRNAAGAVIGVIGTARDITARRQAEQDRLQLERQLLRAQKMETVGTLAGGLAHEFNNLLAAIIGNIELAQMVDPDERTYRPYHESVLQASQRARNLVERVLAFSRSDEPESRPVQLARIVAETVSLIRSTFPRTVELRLDSGPPTPDILADPNQLQQVVMNLAANAAYAMRESGGCLTFRLRAVDLPAAHACAVGVLPAGAYLALEVSDTGKGIEAKNLARIFDPFFTTKPVGEGSGLGLAIVQNIVAAHRGGIEVASVPGAGTTVKLHFPVAPAIARVPVPIASRPAAAGMLGGQGEQVVVIEDEEGVGNVIEMALRRAGYSVRRFAAADEFYAAFKSTPFAIDLVVTDQTMPRLTGLQLARILRAEGYDFPIVMVSGYSSEVTPEAVRSIAPAKFLGKPFELPALLQTLRLSLRAAP